MADRTNANVSYNRLLTEIQKGWGTAFLNQDYQSSSAYKPQFVSNNYREGRKVLASIEDELQDCKEFAISVAFVNTAGIAPLLMMLQELARRGVPGRGPGRRIASLSAA